MVLVYVLDGIQYIMLGTVNYKIDTSWPGNLLDYTVPA